MGFTREHELNLANATASHISSTPGKLLILDLLASVMSPQEHNKSHEGKFAAGLDVTDLRDHATINSNVFNGSSALAFSPDDPPSTRYYHRLCRMGRRSTPLSRYP